MTRGAATTVRVLKPQRLCVQVGVVNVTLRINDRLGGDEQMPLTLFPYATRLAIEAYGLGLLIIHNRNTCCNC